MRRPMQPPTAEQKRHDLVGAAKPLSRPSSQSSFGVVTNATSSLLKSLGVGGPAPPSVKASSGIQALLDGGGSGPTVVSYDDDGSPPKVSKPSMKKNKGKGPARPNFSTSKHPVKPKQPNTKSSPARRWKPKRDPSNPYDDELGGRGEQRSPRSNGIPGLGGNQQEEQEVYFDARNVQRQQQPPLSSANDDPNDDPDYQSYKLFKEQTLRKNEQEDREMEMLLELQRKAEEIERRAQMSREQQQQQQQQMQMQMSNEQPPPMMSIPGLGPPQGNPFQSQPLQPQTIPGLGAPPPMQMPMQQMQIPGLQSAQQQQLPPADDLDFQEFKLFKQQEALKKQREERERMQRQLDQQSLQMSQMNMNTNMNTSMDMNNPYANPNPPQLQLQLQPQHPQGNTNPYNYESENNTLGHSQSFGNGFQQNNFSDPTQGHRSHYDHNHNVESNPNVGGYNQQNNFSDPSQGHRSHYSRNHNAESSSGNNFSSQPGHAPSPERKTFGIKSFFTNPKTEDGQEGQPPPMTMTSPTGNPNSSVSYHSPSPGGKTKHMQALSLMNGPSLDERNGKLQKEIEYRNLLKQQMQEVEERKAKERREKKERQERELAELMEFETHSAKKISKDKKVLANTEFGGQSVKGMLYGGDGSPKRQPRDSPHRSPNRNKRDQLDQREEPNIDVPNFASTTPNDSDIRLPPDLSSSVRSDGGGGGGMGGFAALLSKTGGGGDGEGGGGIPGLDGGGGHDNPYLDDDVDNDGGQSQMQMQMQMPMDPRMAQKEQQIDQLSTMYADLMEEQKAMREALAAQQEEVKKVREREKTLRAGQRGGARRQNKATKGATRDAGGRLIKENGNKSGLLRTQSARRRGDAGPADPYERGSEHYLSPGRRGKKGLGKPKGKGTSSFAGPSEKKYPRGVNRFGFKEGTTTKRAGGGGGGSGPPRDAGGRLIRKKVVETQSRRNPYDDDGDDDYGRGGGGGGGIPGLGGRSPARSNNNPYSDDVGGGAGYDYEPSSAAPPDPRQYSPRLEENHHVQELGGDSDLLYNDPSLDPAHGSIISADQLDRLMLKGLRQDEW